MTEHEDHDHDGENPLAKYEDLFRGKVDDVEDAARKLGLYLRDIGLTMAPDFERHSMQPVMVGNFTIGDVAWSDRIQNPPQEQTEAEFRKMAHQMDRERFEEMKAEMERKLREGKGIFDDTENDADSES